MDSVALDLVNSEEWYGRGGDRVDDHLADAAWLDAFLEKWGFDAVPSPSPRETRALVELRSDLRRIVTAVAGGRATSRRDIARLDRAAAGASLRRRVVADAGGITVDLVPERRDWSWVRSEIAASLVDVLVHGKPERLKLCANPECQWAFYDETKNRRRRWCGHASCGDLDKVRRFRERRRAATTATSARPASARSRRSRR